MFLLVSKMTDIVRNTTVLETRNYNKSIATQQSEERNYDTSDMLSKQVGMNIICTIPCYCDIQFSKREFLTVINYPDHPFAKRIENLAEDKQIKIKYRRKEHE